MNTLEKEVSEIEEELEQLKMKLKRAHFAHSSEQDYGIKSQIIEKQNRLIGILVQENKKYLDMQRHN
jgi:hypothetical protein